MEDKHPGTGNGMCKGSEWEGTEVRQTESQSRSAGEPETGRAGVPGSGMQGFERHVNDFRC